MNAEQAVDALDPIVRIAAFDITIHKWDGFAAQANERFGEFSIIEQTIRIRRVHRTIYETVDTVLHEIGHAIYWAYGIHDEDKEERIVAIMATAWTQVYRDNPWLAAWLTEVFQ